MVRSLFGSVYIRISFAVKLHFLFLFSDAIVAGVVDRWLQKTWSNFTTSIKGHEASVT